MAITKSAKLSDEGLGFLAISPEGGDSGKQAFCVLAPRPGEQLRAGAFFDQLT
jgi:hypothetical protein